MNDNIIEFSKDDITFYGSTEEEKEKNKMMFDLTMENDRLHQELDKYKNVIDKIKKEVLSELQMCKPKEMAISMEINYIEEKLEKLLEEIE